jgi:FtsP/CotA-like multicopper oxidase with cupredoxin domain
VLADHSVTYLGIGSPTHLIHIHDVDWIIVSRNGQPPPPWERGLKEMFFVDAGETVVVTSVFTDHVGPYMLHCHILPHEDNAMMASFEVVP